MNPKEFSWTEDQHVTVINPTEQPFSFKVHSKEYQLGAHKSAKMPGYIAWVYVYGMASQLCQAAGEHQRWNEEGFRQTYYDQVVKKVDAVVQDIEEEPEPAVNTFDEADDQADVSSNTPSAADVAAALAGDDEEGEETPDGQTESDTSSAPVKPAAAVKPMTAKPKPNAAALRSS